MKNVSPETFSMIDLGSSFQIAWLCSFVPLFFLMDCRDSKLEYS